MDLEKRLLKAIKCKNKIKIENIIEDIYYEYGKLVGFVISKYVIKKEDIEELINDVFIAFSKIILKTEIKNIKYYLVTQAKNVAINFLKRKENNVVITYEEKYIDAISYSNSKYYDVINQMKFTLSDDEINIILLHTIYNYSFDEISKKMNKPLSSVATTYRRAIKKYKKGEQ